ncbi:hemolysin type calcium-binding protein [Aliiruegeria haliotis]|uniref:Hemolysin type calcium-binding protein n=1 Tax=Aliiruegeria haliotis TaxID=1280846 RepID=A0A2T0RK23_9RHOB|nr:hypothetical protein [Aliiruegeria haliotis]PRY21534.1 hemolysin type calcium-binding protein [Aliiruegeria haliotis]
MTFNLTTPQAGDALSRKELTLYDLIMDYREENGLDAIPLSENLTVTAGRHVADTLENIWGAGLDLAPGTNLHSWSDAPYYSDHRNPSVMWDAPNRIGASYPSSGFEISTAGPSGISAALDTWKGSAGHNDVILNKGTWSSNDWNAIGIGVGHDPGAGPYGGYIYHVWFGRSVDPDGPPEITGGAGAETLDGTIFADILLGLGGDDTLSGFAGRDLLNGGSGRDTLLGGSGNDIVIGGRGTDTASLGKGRDTFRDSGQGGAAGKDVVKAGPGQDRIKGGGGNDIFKGEAGKDKITGGKGKDRLDGGSGRDQLDGNAGNDLLIGGGHKDTFIFSGKAFGRDRIKDFQNDIVKITSAGEAETRAEFKDALKNTKAGVVYDHLGDGKNTITFVGDSLAEIEAAAVLFG